MSNNQQRLQTIISQLREMRLTTMANQLHSLYLSEQNHAMTPLDYLEVIVNEEYQIRQDNRIGRYWKQATLSHKEAKISDIRYESSRGLRKESIEQLQLTIIFNIIAMSSFKVPQARVKVIWPMRWSIMRLNLDLQGSIIE